jgi:hypothetical protein
MSRSGRRLGLFIVRTLTERYDGGREDDPHRNFLAGAVKVKYRGRSDGAGLPEE